MNEEWTHSPLLSWGPQCSRLRLGPLLPQHPAPSGHERTPSRGSLWLRGGVGPRGVPLRAELPCGLRQHLVGTRSCCGERRAASALRVPSGRSVLLRRRGPLPEAGKAGERAEAQSAAPVRHHAPPSVLTAPGGRTVPRCADQEGRRETLPLSAITSQASHIDSFFYSPHPTSEIPLLF